MGVQPMTSTIELPTLGRSRKGLGASVVNEDMPT